MAEDGAGHASVKVKRQRQTIHRMEGFLCVE